MEFLFDYRAMIPAWLLLGTGILLAWRQARPRVDWTLLVLFVSSFVVRAWFATWGPGDLTMNLNEIFYLPNPHSGYGDAPFVLLKFLFLFLPATDVSIITTSLILGSMAPLVLVKLLQENGIGRRVALLGGVLLAVTPVMVRFSGEGERQVYVILFALTALWALARSRREPRLPYLLIYGAATAICVFSRPESMLLLVMTFLYSAAMADCDRSTWLAHTLTAVFCLGYFFLPTMLLGGDPLAGAGFTLPGLGVLTPRGIVFDSDYTSFVLQGAFWCSVFGARQLSHRSDRQFLLWALLSLWLLLVAYKILNQSAAGLRLTSARYETLSLIPFTVAAALGLERLWVCGASLRARSLRISSFAVVGVSLAFSWVGTLQGVVAPCTVDREYGFIRRTLFELPPNSVIYYVSPDVEGGFLFDIGLRPPFYLSYAANLRDQRWVPWPVPERHTSHPWEAELFSDPGGERPRFYYHSASCTGVPAEEQAELARPMMERCQLAKAVAAPTPTYSAELPWRPYADERYRMDPVPVGFFRLDSVPAMAPELSAWGDRMP